MPSVAFFISSLIFWSISSNALLDAATIRSFNMSLSSGLTRLSSTSISTILRCPFTVTLTIPAPDSAVVVGYTNCSCFSLILAWASFTLDMIFIISNIFFCLNVVANVSGVGLRRPDLFLYFQDGRLQGHHFLGACFHIFQSHFIVSDFFGANKKHIGNVLFIGIIKLLF